MCDKDICKSLKNAYRVWGGELVKKRRLSTRVRKEGFVFKVWVSLKSDAYVYTYVFSREEARRIASTYVYVQEFVGRYPDYKWSLASFEHNFCKICVRPQQFLFSSISYLRALAGYIIRCE